MKSTVTLEEVKSYVEQNNITKPTHLHKENSRYYNFLNNRRLMKEVFPNAQFHSNHKGESRLEEVLQYIKDNNITTRTELQKHSSGMYMCLYYNNMLEEVFGEKQTGKKRGNKISVQKEPKKHKKRTYHGNGMPLTALLVEFLIRWSKEEGVNMEVETRKYGYWTQWREWCNRYGLDLYTGEKIENNE